MPKLILKPFMYIRGLLRKKPRPTVLQKERRVKPIADASNDFVDGQLALLTSLLMEGDYGVFKSAWKHAFNSASSTSGMVKLLCIKAECDLAGGEHEQLMQTASRLTDEYDTAAGDFYKAQSYFVRGQYIQAKKALHSLFAAKPVHVEGTYLLCQIANRTGDKEIAWRALERVAKVSRRPKTWHMMANLVNSDADLFRLLENWSDWKENKVGPAYSKDVSEFVSLAALRAGNDELAKANWRRSLFSALRSKGGFNSFKVRKPNYSSRRAEKALSDINRVLRDANIEMFLVSGTLLGCVREQQLLGHDKDIDIGIWDSTREDEFFDVIAKSGLFFVLPSRSKEIIRLRHVNDIAIDVFYHYREPTDYWHGGVKMVWHNSPFQLVQHSFLGEEYLIPGDYDLYLTENYGDWRTPKIAFDSAFDTPNGEAISMAEMTIHSFKGLMDACISENSEKISFYLDRLADFGETEFVKAFKLRRGIPHVDLSKIDIEE